MRTRCAVLLAVLVLLAGCRQDEVLSGIDDDALEQPGDHAGYLAMRETSRTSAALLVRGLADALGGTVGTIDGDWQGCGQRGEETYAFTYGVTAVVEGARTEPGLPTVGLVLRAQGWTPYDARPHGRGPRREATRDGVSVVVDEGIPATTLVVRTSGGCFPIAEERRREVRQDVGDDRIEVPPPAPPLRSLGRRSSTRARTRSAHHHDGATR